MAVTEENVKWLPKRVRIEQDCEPMSPRDWDNVGRMVCWHRRYNLGDEQPQESSREWLRNLAADKVNATDADLIPSEHIERILKKHFVILPLYLFDHSGITMRCTPFSCPWDSGQVGYIYAEKDKLRKEQIPEDRWELILRQEVETYDHYLTGAVYSYVVEALDYETGEYEVIDSCCGFFGHDIDENGMADALGYDDKLVSLLREAAI